MTGWASPHGCPVVYKFLRPDQKYRCCCDLCHFPGFCRGSTAERKDVCRKSATSDNHWRPALPEYHRHLKWPVAWEEFPAWHRWYTLFFQSQSLGRSLHSLRHKDSYYGGKKNYSMYRYSTLHESFTYAKKYCKAKMPSKIMKGNFSM